MDTAGHRGVTLAAVATVGLVLLGSDALEPTLPVAGAFVLCLGVGYLVAPLPNALEQLTDQGRRGPLHSVFCPLVAAPLLYFSLFGAIAQGQQFLTQSLPSPVSGGVVALLIAATVGGAWTLHILVDVASVSRGRFQFAPLTPVSDRPVALGLYDSDSKIVNASFFLVGWILVGVLCAVFLVQAILMAGFSLS